MNSKIKQKISEYLEFDSDKLFQNKYNLYDGELHEDFKNAIIHCQSMVYSVNQTALMYSENRAMHRRTKLQDRGWKEITNETWVNRDLKINLALK
jgi:hypothetical protein